mmetsp:Transcript_3376/g.3821  ORF Transcript_3376/g.3821 Transcript_3376/m.3821 type:complete len:91 (+) Transcript_3376:205-477(+)
MHLCVDYLYGTLKGHLSSLVLRNCPAERRHVFIGLDVESRSSLYCSLQVQRTELMEITWQIGAIKENSASLPEGACFVLAAIYVTTMVSD